MAAKSQILFLICAASAATFQYYGNRKCEPELLTAIFFVENVYIVRFQ